MREIKFRFYCQSCERFVLPDVSHSYKHGLSARCDNHSVYTECYIDQFTGKLDQEGDEIYRGDIVEDEHEEEHEIVWNKDFACFCLSNAQYIGLGSDEYLKIIGNKYEGVK